MGGTCNTKWQLIIVTVPFSHQQFTHFDFYTVIWVQRKGDCLSD